MSASIYPAIPAPGNSLNTLVPCVAAMRQTLTLILMNAQNPNLNYVPSSASQIFVTYDQLKNLGLVGKQGPQGEPGPPGPGIAEAPNDVNYYARHQLGWQSISVDGGFVDISPNPASSNSSTYIMLGFRLYLSTTLATRLMLAISGNISNDTDNGETDLVVCYGTGTYPSYGAPQTGTIIGQPIRFKTSTGGSISPFCKTVFLTGLTPGLFFWVDLAMKTTLGNGQATELDLAMHGVI